ncbi:MAG: PASTA domain-containing protein [Eggerthellaceae bacterium]|nr:PASTA domain-containing protein [Eggerthellaceae bacterium]
MSAGLLFNVVGDDDGTVIAMYPEQGTQVDVRTTVTILLQ